MVLEDVDRSAIFRAFAQLLDVPPDLLVSRMNLTSNRSMTAAEAEFLRRLNERVKKDLTWDEYVKYVRRGVALGMVEGREPSPDEPRLHTPDWALDAAAEQGARAVETIRASGVRVLGDLDALARRVGSPPPFPDGHLTSCPRDAAVQAVMTVIEATRENPELTARQLRDELLGPHQGGHAPPLAPAVAAPVTTAAVRAAGESSSPPERAAGTCPGGSQGPASATVVDRLGPRRGPGRARAAHARSVRRHRDAGPPGVSQDADVRVRHHLVVSVGSGFHRVTAPDRRSVGALVDRRPSMRPPSAALVVDLADAVESGRRQHATGADLVELVAVADHPRRRAPSRHRHGRRAVVPLARGRGGRARGRRGGPGRADRAAAGQPRRRRLLLDLRGAQGLQAADPRRAAAGLEPERDHAALLRDRHRGGGSLRRGRPLGARARGPAAAAEPHRRLRRRGGGARHPAVLGARAPGSTPRPTGSRSSSPTRAWPTAPSAAVPTSGGWRSCWSSCRRPGTWPTTTSRGSSACARPTSPCATCGSPTTAPRARRAAGRSAARWRCPRG